MEDKWTNESGYDQKDAFSGYGYSENPFDQLEQDLCERCHRRKIDRSENPESTLCKDCREELIKLRIPPVMAGVGALVALLVAACIAVFVIDLASLKTGNGLVSGLFSQTNETSDTKNDKDTRTKEDEDTDSAASEETEAERNTDKKRRLDQWAVESEPDPMCQVYSDLADSGMVVTALDDMVNMLEDDPDNVSIAITLTDVAMKYSYYNYAAYAVDTYLTGKSVSDEEYDRLTGYIDIINLYYDTYDVVDEYWNYLNEDLESLYAAEEDYEVSDEEYAEIIQFYHDAIAEYIGIDGYDQAYLYYELANICQDREERVQHLKDCIAINSNFFDANAQLATSYRRQGDLEAAREILESSYNVNMEAYPVLRSLATLELVEGNLEKGLDYAKKAYDLYAEGEYVVDTYLIALTANGQTEEAEALTKEWEDNGYLFDDDFYSFQMGNMTLEEYYIGD